MRSGGIFGGLYMVNVWYISGLGLGSHMRNLASQTIVPINDLAFLSMEFRDVVLGMEMGLAYWLR
jgi:hypothetical protein